MSHFLLYAISKTDCRNVFGFAAKQATSPAHLVGKLVEFGISSMDTHAFAEEIYSRVPRRSSGINVSFSILSNVQ